MATQSKAPDPEEPSGSVKESYERHRVRLREFVVANAREPDNADDVVQEVYVHLLRRRAIEPIRQWWAYLKQIALNVLRARHGALLKEERRHVHCTPTELEELAEGLRHLQTEDDSESQALEAELQRVLKELPLPCQIAWIRHRHDGWTYDQIAAELELSRDQVRRHLGRALAHFDAYFSTDPTDRSAEKDRP